MTGHYKRFLGAAAVAVAAAAAPAHADTIRFEGYNSITLGTDVYTENNYNVGFYANTTDGGVNSLVGQFIDGDGSVCDSGSMLCPKNISGNYYAAFDDSYLDITGVNGGFLHVNSFDASFIGGSTSTGAYAGTPGLVRVQGFLANGSSLSETYALTGATSTGFQFAHFDASAAFAANDFIEVAIFGYTCDTSGSCNAFNSNRGQFAIDNIALNEVPEPATLAIVGLGMLGLGAARRRRTS